MIDRAYRFAESLGVSLWTQDEAGPFQTIPYVSIFIRDGSTNVHQCWSAQRKTLGQFLVENGATLPRFLGQDDGSIGTSFSGRRDAP